MNGAPKAHARYEDLKDPAAVGEGFARVIEEEGLRVACARGAYFAEEWAVVVCRHVDPRDVREALRRCVADPELRDAVMATAALTDRFMVRSLFTGGKRFIGAWPT